MSDAPASPPRAAPPLDEVMLAMDVVDTLRAQHAIVEAELDGEARADAFADRVKSIYASQGIDVPDDVIAEAVEALEQDRFTYAPPKRTFAVRLAELYVDRGVWLRRAALLAVLVAVVWGVVAWVGHRRDRRLVEGFRKRQAALALDARAAAQKIDGLYRRLDHARKIPGELKIGAELLDAAEQDLRLIRKQATMALDAEPLDAEVYPARTQDLDAALAERQRDVAALEAELGNVAGQLELVQRLQGLGGRVTVALAEAAGVTATVAERAEIERLHARAEAELVRGNTGPAEAHVQALQEAVAALVRGAAMRKHVEISLDAAQAELDGMTLDEDLRSEIRGLVARARALLDARDVDAAAARMAELQQLAKTLGLAYELRIVSRPGEKSGVWRHPAGRPNVKNHYIVVEPVGPDGRVLAIPVRNEEDQITRTVRKFAVRVPASVYEAVKADKLDNGIVDASLFGTKRRGARSPEYRYEVSGGWITDW